MCKGIIYLVQPAEYSGTNKFKIGMSKDMSLKRFNAYGAGSRYLSIMETFYPLELEQIIKTKFSNQFMLFTGREYFEANEKDIKKEFLKIIDEFEENCNKIFTICKKIKNEINSQDLVLSPVFCSIISKELQKQTFDNDIVKDPPCNAPSSITINTNVIGTQININNNEIKGTGIRMNDIVSNINGLDENTNLQLVHAVINKLTNLNTTKKHKKSGNKNKVIIENEFGEKQFNCNKCKKIFKSESGLWKHNNNYHHKIKTKNDEPKTYNCEYCKKKFGYYQSRWRHEQKCNKACL